MGKLQRNRGANYEREVANELTDLLGHEFRRVLGQERDGGGDVQSEDVDILFECKRRRSLKCLYDWMDQAIVSAAQQDMKPQSHIAPLRTVPVVVFRGDNAQSLVILRLDDITDFAGEVLGD